MGIIQPYLDTVVQALLGLVTAVVIAALIEIRKKVLEWIDKKATNEQRDLIYKLAKEAFSFAETVYHQMDGRQKLDGAIAYLSKRLNDANINLTEEEIRAVIEGVVLGYNKDGIVLRENEVR